MKHIMRVIAVLGLIMSSGMAHSAYESRFDAINFDPAVDGGGYITVYGSQNLKAWQGVAGFYFDYANRPLEFRATGGATGRQSILDSTFIMNLYGALGFTDWFTAGLNIPIVAYNQFFTDDVFANSDNGGGMGDVSLLTKFRAIDIEKHRVGLSFLAGMTLPTGDIVRYNGSGHITGQMKVIFDARLHDRVEASLNVGGVMRDDVTRNYNFAGGATSTVRVDDLFTYGLGVNVKFAKNFQGIVETQGSTVMRNFFSNSNTTSLEAGGGVRYFFGDSGFAVDAGGTAGLIEGIGTPKFRAYVGLRWKSPVSQPCPACEAPDPRIQGDRIVLWGKIFYDTNKATIKPISFPVLDDVVDVLNKHPEITLVEVQGHTDFRGSDPFNMKLSDARAHSAMQYLISKGISSTRLTAKGYGESQPIASNDTVEGMSQNRRTEFVILQSTGGFVNAPNPGEVHSQNTQQPTNTATNPANNVYANQAQSGSSSVPVNDNRPTTDSGLPNYSSNLN